MNRVRSGMLRADTADGRCVCLHVPSGTYLELNESAASILDALRRSEPPAAVAAALRDRHGISWERARADVAAVQRAVEALDRKAPPSRRSGSAKGFVDVLGQWGHLPLRRKWLTATVVPPLLVAEVGLRILDIRRLSALLQVPLEVGAPSRASPRVLPEGLDADEQARARAVNWVLSRWIYPDTCLRRALVLGFFLRRRKPVLRLGLSVDADTAHAWVEAGDVAYDVGEIAGVFSAPNDAPGP